MVILALQLTSSQFSPRALVSLVTFVHHIHHVAQSIRTVSIIGRIAKETSTVIDTVYLRTARPAQPSFQTKGGMGPAGIGVAAGERQQGHTTTAVTTMRTMSK